MKKQITVFLGLILTLSSAAIAQTKTVTNSDLEKFRQKRLQSERQYRENYERLGFPSPEELERKRIEDEKKLIEYSRQLELQRLEREALQTEAENEMLRSQNQYLQSQFYNSGYQTGGYVVGYSPYYGYNNFYRPRRGSRNRLLYDSTNFQKYNPTFFNLQFPPPRPPQRILAPRTRTNNPRVIIRTGRGRN